jgi:hypothetical protein
MAKLEKQEKMEKGALLEGRIPYRPGGGNVKASYARLAAAAVQEKLRILPQCALTPCPSPGGRGGLPVQSARNSFGAGILRP